MANSPKYDVNDIVYFKSSAARGFIEPVKIGIVAKIDSTWVYGLRYKTAEPSAPRVFGDRISFGGIGSQQVYYTEDEFQTYCEALGVAERYLAGQLTAIQSLISASCGVTG
jgi:hypothetical protein